MPLAEVVNLKVGSDSGGGGSGASSVGTGTSASSASSSSSASLKTKSSKSKSNACANTSRDSDDLGSGDEIKVYKDEGADDEEQHARENLNEDKIGLVNEEEVMHSCFPIILKFN